MTSEQVVSNGYQPVIGSNFFVIFYQKRKNTSFDSLNIKQNSAEQVLITYTSLVIKLTDIPNYSRRQFTKILPFSVD